MSQISAQQRRRLKHVDATGVKQIVKWAFVYLLFGVGLLRLARWMIGRRGGIVVLTFHRVLPDAAFPTTFSLPGMVVSESMFLDFLRHLSKHFEIVDLRSAETSNLFNRKALRFAITFDDGWVDTRELAQPIARQFSVPMAVFICSKKMETKAPFWPERVMQLLRELRSSKVSAQLVCTQPGGSPIGLMELSLESCQMHPEKAVERLKTLQQEELGNFLSRLESLVDAGTQSEDDRYPEMTMSWKQARELLDSGVAIGSHTRNHSILTNLPPSGVRPEIFDSKKEIEEQLGHPCALFAYPNGNYTRDVRDTVEQAGYRFAFTTKPGYWTKDEDPWLVPRINVWERSLAGLDGKFSKMAFEYSVLWKAFRAGWRH